MWRIGSSGCSEAAGHEVVRAGEVVWTNALATSEARRVADARPDLTIFNIPVWAFPHFTMLAAARRPGPLLLFSNIDPQYPGMVGMLAAAGALDQIGRTYARAWGDIATPRCSRRIDARVRAGGRGSGLRGSTFGRIGGRPMGMYTAVANTDQWMRAVRRRRRGDRPVGDRAALRGVERRAVRAAREWLERHAAGVHYDGEQLTPELLERQIRSYYAMRELIDEWNLDFSGIKGQPELTDHFATMDVTEAFLNDPYDWDGPKEPHVCATEADMDAALTMQVLKRLSGDAGAVRRRPALPRRPRRLGPLQLRPARHLVRGPQRRPGREHAPGAPLPRGVLLPGRRRVRAPPRRARATSRSPGSRGTTAATGCTSCAARSSATTTRRTSDSCARPRTSGRTPSRGCDAGAERSSPASARTTSTRSPATTSRSCELVCELLDVDYDGFGGAA